MKAELITPAAHHDDIVCDAARVSFAKRASEFTPKQNAKLRRYLFRPRGGEASHWAPFAMPRICLALPFAEARRSSYMARRSSYTVWVESEVLDFLTRANLAGFSWAPGMTYGAINGSLWAWYENLHYFPDEVQCSIVRTLRNLYPDCAEMFEWPALEKDFAGYWEVDPAEEIAEPGHPDLIYESVRVTAPIFVARQLVKHQRHLVWSEVSRRYVDDVPELYFPEKWHKRPDGSIKQGASAEEFYSGEDSLIAYATAVAEDQVRIYVGLIEQGLAPEEARILLPLNSMTQWIWTGSLSAFKRIMRERLASNAQGATRDCAQMINEEMISKYGSNWRNI
jgi:thymidylate synthase (FAD)